MKAALVQLTVGDDPAANLRQTLTYVQQAIDKGAAFVLTPEVTNVISPNRTHLRTVLHHEADDPTLSALRDVAAHAGVWVSIGSLALRTTDADDRFANRSFLIDPKGRIAASYDKIHMFDVTVSETETYRESAHYRPGGRAVVAETDFGCVGLSVCYDIRFAHLYRALAQAGADILLVPAAFSTVTGAAHWETLLRARAIETGCFVLAAAQTGHHGGTRHTWGHSMAVDPWGRVILDAGTAGGVSMVEIDVTAVSDARKRIPALRHDRNFEGP